MENKPINKKAIVISIVCCVLLVVAAVVLSLNLPAGIRQTVSNNAKKNEAEKKPEAKQTSISGDYFSQSKNALKQAITDQSIKDLDQVLLNIINTEGLTKKQKFSLLWGNYEKFKNSNSSEERKLAHAVLQAIVSMDTKHATAQIIQELNSNNADTAAKKTLLLALTRQFEPGGSLESRANNEAILAALKARTSDADVKVAATAALDYAAIGHYSDVIPVLDSFAESEKISPSEYVSRLMSQLMNIREPGLQLEVVQKIIDTLTKNSTNIDVQKRVLETVPGMMSSIHRRVNLQPQAIAILLPFLQKLNPLSPVGAPTLLIRPDRLTYEMLMQYPEWLEAVSTLSGQSWQQTTDLLAKNSKELNTSPEAAAAILLSRSRMEFEKQIRSYGNAQILSSALINKAGAIPQPNNVSQQLIDLSVRLGN
jgi:hypothetical protein